MTDRFVGLDVHKATIAVAIAEAEDGNGEVRHYGTIQHQPADIAKLINHAGKRRRLSAWRLLAN